MSVFEFDGAELEYGGSSLQAWELANEREPERESAEAEQYEDEAEADEYEADEYELADELLNVRNEAELDRFLGNLVRSAGTALNSGVGRAVGGVLKNVAGTALPFVGATLGSAIAPGVGTVVGRQLGALAGGLLEVGEAETMGEEEAEFEAARRFVRFGQATSRNAAMASPRLPAKTVARAAAVAAARRHAPGLVRRGQQSFRDRRDTRRSAPQRARGQRDPGTSGHRQRDPGSAGASRQRAEDPGAPRRRRPAPPWSWPSWQPAPWSSPPWSPAPWGPVPWQPARLPQPEPWQPSDAWAGPAGRPDGRSGSADNGSGGRPGGPADNAGPAGGPGPGSADGPGPAGGPAPTDGGGADEPGEFEFGESEFSGFEFE